MHVHLCSSQNAAVLLNTDVNKSLKRFYIHKDIKCIQLFLFDTIIFYPVIFIIKNLN